MPVWKFGSFTVWQSGSLAVVVSGIDGIERSSVAVVVVLKGTVYQKKLSHADVQGVGGLLVVLLLLLLLLPLTTTATLLLSIPSIPRTTTAKLPDC